MDWELEPSEAKDHIQVRGTERGTDGHGKGQGQGGAPHALFMSPQAWEGLGNF